jgi:hypothetical protein
MPEPSKVYVVEIGSPHRDQRVVGVYNSAKAAKKSFSAHLAFWQQCYGAGSRPFSWSKNRLGYSNGYEWVRATPFEITHA